MTARVGIDAHFLAKHEGNRAYVRGLLTGLSRIATAELEVRAYVPRRALALELANVRFEALFPSGRGLRVAVAPLLAGLRHGLDLWHATFSAPPLGGPRVVLAVHDALFATRPDLLPRALAWRLALTLPRAIRRAARVVVPTEAVMRELVLATRADPARVAVVPIGVDLERFRPEADPAADARARAALGLDPARPYVLAVGRADPRKRLPLLAGAVASAEREARAGARLVLVGPISASEAAELRAAAAKVGVGLDVVRDAPDDALPALYRGASALAFPSAGEGAGVPVMEALACGTPVVASDLAPVREVAGGAALALFPPDDADALAAALSRALARGEDVARARASGPARAAAFSVEACARGTVEAWREALA